MADGDVKVLQQGVADLWDSIGELQQGNALIVAKLASIEALLTERCTTRAAVIGEMGVKIKELQDKYNLLDKIVLKNTLIVSGITAALSSVATALAVKVLGEVFGG